MNCPATHPIMIYEPNWATAFFAGMFGQQTTASDNTVCITKKDAITKRMYNGLSYVPPVVTSLIGIKMGATPFKKLVGGVLGYVMGSIFSKLIISPMTSAYNYDNVRPISDFKVPQGGMKTPGLTKK